MGKFNPFLDTVAQIPDISTISKSGDIENEICKQKGLYDSVLSSVTVIDQNEREQNIFDINDYQDKVLQLQNNLEMIPGSQDHEFHRKLLAYYRPTQITHPARMQIIEIMKFTRYYIEQGYSQIFDTFGVLYRFPETDIVKEFSNNSYDVNGIVFRMLSSLYANTIHFSDGTPDFVPGTIPILGTTPYERNKRKGDSIHLPLSYDVVDKNGGKCLRCSPEDKKAADKLIEPSRLFPVLSTMLETLQKTEKAMLENIK